MIEVRRKGSNAFAVTVREGKSATEHDVTLSDADHARLAANYTAEDCVKAAFGFLLDREAKESILSRFDLMVIARYFPEFERELPNYLAGC